PEKIIRDLDLDLELRRREIGSYTPYQKDGRNDGLLLSYVSEELNRQSLLKLTGNDAEFSGMKRFYGLARVFAAQVWDTMLQPLAPREEFRRRFEQTEVGREA